MIGSLVRLCSEQPPVQVSRLRRICVPRQTKLPDLEPRDVIPREVGVLVAADCLRDALRRHLSRARRLPDDRLGPFVELAVARRGRIDRKHDRGEAHALDLLNERLGVLA